MARLTWKWTSIATVPDLCPTTVKIITHLISPYHLPLKKRSYAALLTFISRMSPRQSVARLARPAPPTSSRVTRPCSSHPTASPCNQGRDRDPPYRKKCSLHFLERVPQYTANNLPFMYFQNRFSQASLLISNQYFQIRIVMFTLELWYSVEKYSTRCSHSAVSIWNKSGIIKLQIRTTEMLLNFYFFF